MRVVHPPKQSQPGETSLHSETNLPNVWIILYNLTLGPHLPCVRLHETDKCNILFVTSDIKTKLWI